MNNDVRRLSIAYRALSRLDRPAQMASLRWLQDRLQADEENRIAMVWSGLDKLTRREREHLSDIVGDAAVNLIRTMMIAGAVKAKRKCEVAGPLDVDVTVTVEKRKGA